MDRMVLINVPIVCALNTLASASKVSCMHGRPTFMLGLVDEMLCCCLGFRTLNIHCVAA